MNGSLDGTRPSRPSLPAVLMVVGAYFVLEVLWGSLRGHGLPVGVWAFAAGLVGLLVVATTLVLGLRTLAVRRPRWAPGVVLGLVLGVLWGKLWLVAGGRTTPAAVLGLAVPVVVGFLLVRWWSEKPHTAGWIVLAVLAVAGSTDAVKIVWLQTREGTIGTLTGTGAGLAAAAGVLGAFVVLWDPLERLLRKRRAWAAVLLAGALVAAGVVWASTWEFSLWARGVVGEDPHFEGDVGEVREAGDPAEFPNLILISVDTLRWDMVPPHVDPGRLPHLSELRRDSVRFPLGFSTSTWTLPAHASLLSGRLPIQTGAVVQENRMYPELTLFPQYLRKAGYRTGAFTDGGFVSREYGFQRGFDVYWEQGIPYRSPNDPYRRFAPGALEILSAAMSPVNGGIDLAIRHRELDQESRLRHFERNTRAARAWIDDGPADEPFFLFLHTFRVHDYRIRNFRIDTAGWPGPESLRFYPEDYRRLQREYPALALALGGMYRSSSDTEPLDDEAWETFVDPPAEGFKGEKASRLRRRVRSLEGPEERVIRRRLGAYPRSDWSILQRELGAMSERDWDNFRDFAPERRKRLVKGFFEGQMPDLEHRRRRAMKQLYRYGVQAFDRSLGEFLASLKTRGLYEDSLIVFLSDHGEGFRLEHGVHGHAGDNLHEVLIRVPLWIKLPGGAGASRDVDAFLSLRDVFPALFRHLGLQIEGRNPSAVAPGGWIRSSPLEVPRRSFVRVSNARNLHNLSADSPGRKRVKLGVRGATHKQVRWRDLQPDEWARIHDGHLFQDRLSPDSVPREQRRRIRHEMRNYEALLKDYPDPFLRTDSPLDEGLRRELRGLGYF